MKAAVLFQSLAALSPLLAHAAPAIEGELSMREPLGTSENSPDRRAANGYGCYNGYCWANCALGWCYTGHPGSGGPDRCHSGCNPEWHCHGSCFPF